GCARSTPPGTSRTGSSRYARSRPPSPARRWRFPCASCCSACLPRRRPTSTRWPTRARWRSSRTTPGHSGTTHSGAARPPAARPPPGSRAAEARLALVREGPEPFREVARGRHLLLDLGLQFELLLHPLVEPAVELPFGSRIGPGGAVGEPDQQLGGARRELAVRPDLVDQAPLQRPACADPLTQHRHLCRPRAPYPPA